MADNVKNKRPTVHTHEGTKLKFLRGSKYVLFETGVKVPVKDFVQLENGGLAERLVQLEDSDKYDFVYACSTGYLRRKKSPTPARKEKVQSPAGTEWPSRTVEQKETAPLKRKFQLSSVFLVMVVMCIVGIGSAVMSSYHTTMFLLYGGKPAWTAVLTGIMFILFSGTAFTAARYFIQEKGFQMFFGFLFIVAGFAVITYSMFSTLTVSYNQFQWRDDERAVVAVGDNEQLASHERLLHMNGEALNEVNARIVKIESDMEYWMNMSWRRYDELQAQLEVANTTRSELRNRRIELESSKPELVAQAEVSQETIYIFLARLLKLQEDVTRFLVYVIPACLYDILAPFALSIVLLLVDRRKQNVG